MRFKYYISTILIVLGIIIGNAQAPESMNYQAVIRNGSGNVVANQTVSLRIKILQGSVSGSPVYVETFNPTTNAYGSIAIQIGTGSVITGTFNTIDWGANSYFVETAVDISGWANYTVISTTQLMSVPYALYAKTAGNAVWQQDVNNDINFGQGNVGIGTTSPSSLLQISHNNAEGPTFKLDGLSPSILFQDNSGVSNTVDNFEIRNNLGNLNFNYGDNSDANDDGFLSNTALTISSIGNVGIGNSDPKERLQLGNNMFFHANSIVNALMFNQYWNGSNWTYANDGPTSGVEFNSSGIGQINFWTSTSGTAGNQVTPQSRFSILNDGTTRISDLAGTGDRMVVADADGDLSTQSIPSGGASSINDLSDALVENNSLFIGNNPSSTTNSASYNLSLGTGALSNITTADKNTAVGTDALKNHTEGSENVALGYVALRDNTIGQWNVAVGKGALLSTSSGGSRNIAIGTQALSELNGNVSALNTSVGSNNIAIGHKAGEDQASGGVSLITGTKNILIGHHVSASSSSAENEIVIGAEALGSGNNTVTLGNSSIANVKTSGSITAGAITIPNTDGSNGQVLSTNGNGTLSWTSPSGSSSPWTESSSNIYRNSGNVGIGTNSPNSLLEISNENNSSVTPLLTLVNNDANNNYTGIRLMEGSSYNYGFSIMYDDNGTFGASNTLTLLRHDNSSTGAPFMTALRSNGRVGFGTTSPNSLVEIKTENSSSIDPTNHVTEALRLVAEYANDWAGNPHEGGVGVKFMLDNQNGNYWPTGEINFIGENSDNNEGHGGFQFKVNNNTAGGGGNDESTASSNTTAMVINHEGKVGIGTNSPTTNLHVEGSILVDAYSGGSGTKGIFFRDGFVNSNTYNSSILVYDHNGTGSTPDGLSLNGYDGVSFSTGSNSRNERMRISSDGNVGIGTETPNAKLEVSGTTRITDLAGSGNRMVVADADGDLSTQAIPSGGSSMPNGNNNGDMMYWDGSAWQTIAVGSAGAVLQIIGGVPTWVSTPDITGPTITLNGNANMNVVLNGTFTDPGATTDEGTLTTSGTVDVTTAGTYTITYSATDATGNTATATRTVAVYQSQFNYTGSVQTFTVPAGVTSINVDAYGANGESKISGYGGGWEGRGGRVQADLAVTPGEVLNIYVGGTHYYTGSGSFGGGWNGGGADGGDGGSAGGGATDIRIGGTALTDRVLVAGGGGGCSNDNGVYNGGDGGDLTGETGSRYNNAAYGGGGGTQAAGGAGGTGTDGGCNWISGSNGGSGSLGNGGNGNTTRERRGGGGGGGYYGGGGGAIGCGFGWGGGGGGSSYTHPTLCSSVVHTQGAQSRSLSVAVHGSLTITIP